MQHPIMFNSWLLPISLVVAINAETLIVDNYKVTIENSTLTSVRPTSDSSGELDLSNLNLRYIDEQAFSHNLEMKNLSLANNELRYLHPFVFRSLSDKLEYLSLANTTIMNLRYVFGGLNKLRAIDIRDNNIPELNVGSFYGLSNGIKIIADRDVFSAIRSEHFENPFPLLSLCIVNGVVKSLIPFGKDNENDECVAKIRPLMGSEVRLVREGITGFAKRWYRISDPRVTDLNLQCNEITSITSEIMNDLPKSLTRVNLSYNKIAILKNGVIENFHLRSLNLRKNVIAEIENRALANTENLRVYLHGNKLPVAELAKNITVKYRIYRERYSSYIIVNSN